MRELRGSAQMDVSCRYRARGNGVACAGERRMIGRERDVLDTPVPLVGLQELVVVEEA